MQIFRWLHLGQVPLFMGVVLHDYSAVSCEANAVGSEGEGGLCQRRHIFGQHGVGQRNLTTQLCEEISQFGGRSV